MSLLQQAWYLLRLTCTHDIVRRYFVVNGFDGALTMLGLIIGFLISAPASLTVVLNACLGVAIALGMSGISSVYVSETAERKRALGKLEEAMATDLQKSAHGDAARCVPLLIALVNGSAPLVISRDSYHKYEMTMKTTVPLHFYKKRNIIFNATINFEKDF